MSIAVVTMVRNEAQRYLPSALCVWRHFASEIIAYDDHSDDGTSQLLAEAGATIVEPVNEAAWGAEAAPRRALWNAAITSSASWLLWLDADMIPAADVRDLEARDVDAVAFRLYDLWHWRAAMYRCDGAWQAHTAPRIWMIRNPRYSATQWSWHERGIHCGHLPSNYTPRRVLVAPEEYSILHYGYAEHTDRSAKSAQYASQEHALSPSEILHARSIADDAYITLPLPFKPLWQLKHQRASSSAVASDSRNVSLTLTGAVSPA